MISEKQKQNIHDIINRMADREEKYMNEFTPDERGYIISILETQTMKKGFCMELSNNREKLKKICLIQ